MKSQGYILFQINVLEFSNWTPPAYQQKKKALIDENLIVISDLIYLEVHSQRHCSWKQLWIGSHLK